MKELNTSELSFDAPGWKKLVKTSKNATFFQTPEWMSLWVKHFGEDKEVKILGVFNKEEFIGVAPLILSTPGESTSNTPGVFLLGPTPVLGGELVSDFGDIVAFPGKENDVWRALLDNLNNVTMKQYNNETIEFDFIREDSPSFKILKDLGGKVKEVDVAPYIDLPDSWDDYLANLERKNRHELRRKIRRLESEGAFRVCHEGEPVDIDDFFRLVSLSSEKRDFLSPKMRSFFEDIFSQLFPKKMACLCFMKLSGKNIAVSMLFIFKEELLLYNSGFDPQFGFLSPGFLLKAFIIKHAIEERKKRFDFLRGGERYKYDLGGRKRRLYKIIFR